MYDASVKVPTGVEHGNVYQFGNFDQCMGAASLPLYPNDDDTTAAVDNSNRAARSTDIQSKYCLADVTLDGYSVRTGAARHFQVGLFILICIPCFYRQYWTIYIHDNCDRF